MNTSRTRSFFHRAAVLVPRGITHPTGRTGSMPRVVLSLVLTSALSLGMVACGSDKPSPPTSHAGGSSTSPDTFGTDANEGQWPRTIRHARGETTVRHRPERVVVIDGGELDVALAYGVTPVGIVTSSGGDIPSYLADRMGAITTAGTWKEPNLEKIASLRPDLIIGSALRVGELYDRLAQIAPTVLSTRPGVAWKDDAHLFAQAMGREKEYKQVIGRYDDRVAALRGRIPVGETVSLVRFMGKEIRLYANGSFPGVILKDLGVTRPAQENVPALKVNLSDENIDKVSGDRVLYSGYGDPGNAQLRKVVDGPLWGRVPAVGKGRAEKVSDDTWFLGLGPLGANRVLDDVEQLYK
ncbi:ABC transporter substrate-binding protein [Corynebacterium kroppenstedtii]|uniref:ABC transporter substrate-binding protein n=1 Tax=Corynebacterium sp. PCR 32 TaxID=3351342 RepID=UPI00309B28F6